MEEKEDFIKERLLQSLQRGNLQSVTFVGKDGKTEKLFISPDIPLGALKVYDENKTRILNTKPGRKRIHRK